MGFSPKLCNPGHETPQLRSNAAPQATRPSPVTRHSGRNGRKPIPLCFTRSTVWPRTLPTHVTQKRWAT
jgi:hypothetical protein